MPCQLIKIKTCSHLFFSFSFCSDCCAGPSPKAGEESEVGENGGWFPREWARYHRHELPGSKHPDFWGSHDMPRICQELKTVWSKNWRVFQALTWTFHDMSAVTYGRLMLLFFCCPFHLWDADPSHCPGCWPENCTPPLVLSLKMVIFGCHVLCSVAPSRTRTSFQELIAVLWTFSRSFKLCTLICCHWLCGGRRGRII